MLVVLSFLACGSFGMLELFGNTTTAQGIIIGADIPLDIALPPESGIYSASCKMLLTEVTDFEDTTTAKVSGANVRYVVQSEGILPFKEEESGVYTLYSDDGLVYEPGEEAVVRFSADDKEGKLCVEMPEAPIVEMSSTITTGDDVHVQVVEGRFANFVIVVYDVNHEKLVWDNLPDSIDEMNEFSVNNEIINELTIPGDAFKRESVYIVGVGGLEIADADTLEGVNSLFSIFAAAKLDLHSIVANKK